MNCRISNQQAKQCPLMEADFPFLRHPEHKCYCYDRSTHLMWELGFTWWFFWFVCSYFALGLLKSMELFSKERFWAENRGPGPGVWMGLFSFSECKAESFVKLRQLERKQVPQESMECDWLWAASLCSPTEHWILAALWTVAAALLEPAPTNLSSDFRHEDNFFYLFIHAFI